MKFTVVTSFTTYGFNLDMYSVMMELCRYTSERSGCYNFIDLVD